MEAGVELRTFKEESALFFNKHSLCRMMRLQVIPNNHVNATIKA
jgi:hypothetical protein